MDVEFGIVIFIIIINIASVAGFDSDENIGKGRKKKKEEEGSVA
jgi:predicted house-cleaning noncanonical NTP pyrophosphatase (MazG superfamily)